MSTSFDNDTAVSPCATGEGDFTAEVSELWRAGRGPHGGYLAAILLRALTLALADPSRQPRSLTIHYASAPKPGPVAIHTKIERHGRSLSTLSARMEQEGKLMALALAAFSVPWKAEEISELPMPQVEAPAAERQSSRLISEFGPPFTRKLVMQPRVGAVPFTEAQAPMEIGGWTGFAEPRPIDPLALALFCDAWIPPAFIALKEPAFAPTVDLTVHFHAPTRPVEDPEELCLAVFRARLVHDGFFVEDGVIWAPDGSVLAQSRQLGIIMPTDKPVLQPSGASAPAVADGNE
ncbi:MAG TPA: thioesterase family protein [Solirubrobacteraceae bacterium]|jgi:acyl-CoA thioesterase